MKYSDYEQIKLVNFSAQQNFGIATSSVGGGVKGAVKGAKLGAGLGGLAGAGKAMVSGLNEMRKSGKYGAIKLAGKMTKGAFTGAAAGSAMGGAVGLALGSTGGAVKGLGKEAGGIAKSTGKEIGGFKKFGSEVAGDFRKAAGMNSPKVADVNPELYYLVEHVKGGVELVDKKGYGDREDAKMVLDRKTGNSRSEHSILKGTTLAQKYAGQFKLNYNS